MKLEDIGWSPVRENSFAAVKNSTSIPARVSRENRGAYTLLCEAGEIHAEVSGRFRHHSQNPADFPAVGDWVAAELPDGNSRGIIHAVLPRHSAFVRRAAGTKGGEQVVSANVDTVFIVNGLDHDFNPRRIERYLTLAYESGADPVIILNKADIHAAPQQARKETEAVAYGVPVLVVSAVNGTGLEEFKGILKTGMTGALLGSSGVGKSTLVNALMGSEVLRTAQVREDDSKGRHTTTYRQLLALPGGAVLIDTPGMRELQLIGDAASLARSFDEISELANNCRFRDCSHTGEPGCAVQEALAEGSLEAERYESYLRQRKEISHHQREQDVHLQIQEKKKWQAIHRSMRVHHKRRQD